MPEYETLILWLLFYSIWQIFPSDDAGMLEWQFPCVLHLFYFLEKVVFVLTVLYFFHNGIGFPQTEFHLKIYVLFIPLVRFGSGPRIWFLFVHSVCKNRQKEILGKNCGLGRPTGFIYLEVSSARSWVMLIHLLIFCMYLWMPFLYFEQCKPPALRYFILEP